MWSSTRAVRSLMYPFSYPPVPGLKVAPAPSAAFSRRSERGSGDEDVGVDEAPLLGRRDSGQDEAGTLDDDRCRLADLGARGKATEKVYLGGRASFGDHAGDDKTGHSPVLAVGRPARNERRERGSEPEAGRKSDELVRRENGGRLGQQALDHLGRARHPTAARSCRATTGGPGRGSFTGRWYLSRLDPPGAAS